MVQVCVPPEEPEENRAVKGDARLEEQLRQTQDRLQMKEREVRGGPQLTHATLIDN